MKVSSCAVHGKAITEDMNMDGTNGIHASIVECAWC